MIFSAMVAPGVADQDDEDEEDDARERDAVAAEPPPHLLPVAAGADLAGRLVDDRLGQGAVGLADLACDGGVFSRGGAHGMRGSLVGMRVGAYPLFDTRIPI